MNKYNDIKTVEDLTALFKIWKDKQQHEAFESCQKTFPIKKSGQTPCFEKFKESFCPDGYITDANNYNGILIICRESNVSHNEIMGEFNDTFAMKDSENNVTLYYNFIKKALNKLNKACSDEDIKKCAYMNLNKRGGYGSTNPKRLANYVEEYKLFIEKEIELLAPDYIICGGTYGTVKRLNLPKDIEIYDCYHPACRRKIFKMLPQHDIK